MWPLKIAAAIVAVYLILLIALFFLQGQLIFPRGLVAEAARTLPASAERLSLATPGGETLAGLRMPPAGVAPGPPGADVPLTIIGYGGNAWHADDLAMFLRDLFPAATIVTFHYRGYAPSTGTPGAAAILADALRQYDHLAEHDALPRGGKGATVLVGFSLGSAVATHVAAERPVAGLILVSPFDSMGNLAQQHYPWMPAKWLLRHRFATAQWARTVDEPVALIAAAEDTLVPPARTAPLRNAFADIVYDRTLPGVGHIDIYHDPAFEPAMRAALGKILE